MARYLTPRVSDTSARAGVVVAGVEGGRWLGPKPKLPRRDEQILARLRL
jgi:hypothetical protein